MFWIAHRSHLLFSLLGCMLLILVSCNMPGTVSTALTDTAIQLNPANVKAGKVTFKITNNTSSNLKHELVVVLTDIPADKVPMDSAGDVDEDQLKTIGEQEDIEPNKTVDLILDLPPGHYLLLCNLPGHYQKGMYTELVASL